MPLVANAFQLKVVESEQFLTQIIKPPFLVHRFIVILIYYPLLFLVSLY
jgi:hypothetical protein